MNPLGLLSQDGVVLLMTLLVLCVAYAFFVLILGGLCRAELSGRRGLIPVCAAALCLQSADLALFFSLARARFGPPAERIAVHPPVDLPLWAHVLFFCVCAGIETYALVRIVRIMRHSFSPASVRQAIDDLPTGMCFAAEDGNPLLTNKTMYALVREITGERLRNMREFWSLLRARADAARETPEALTVLLEDDRYFRFSLDTLYIRGKRVRQLLAADVTPYYRIFRALEKDNAALAAQRVKLRALSENLEQMNHEEEVLHHKILMHNEIGRTVLATRRFLTAPRSDPENIKIYSVLWRDLCDRNSFADAADPGDGERKLREIFETARQIGCGIELTGEPPAEELYAGVLRQVLREAVVNAVRHADAERLFVRIEREGGILRYTVGNDGRRPAGPVREGGGLTALRRAVENAGGGMTVSSADGFLLTVVFPLPRADDGKGEEV